jgi:hypothetical protein
MNHPRMRTAIAQPFVSGPTREIMVTTSTLMVLNLQGECTDVSVLERFTSGS